MTNNYFKVTSLVPVGDTALRSVDQQFFFFDDRDQMDAFRCQRAALAAAKRIGAKVSVWRGSWTEIPEISVEAKGWN